MQLLLVDPSDAPAALSPAGHALRPRPVLRKRGRREEVHHQVRDQVRNQIRNRLRPKGKTRERLKAVILVHQVPVPLADDS